MLVLPILPYFVYLHSSHCKLFEKNESKEKKAGEGPFKKTFTEINL